MGNEKAFALRITLKSVSCCIYLYITRLNIKIKIINDTIRMLYLFMIIII